MKEKDIIEYGAKQIEMIKDAVGINDEQFSEIISAAKNEQLAGGCERGTLALEEEKADRPVDKFCYSKYRRAFVDQMGAFFSYGIFIRVMHLFVDSDIKTKSIQELEEEKAKTSSLTDTVSSLIKVRSNDYYEEMRGNADAILYDLCGFIDSIDSTDFYWLSVPVDASLSRDDETVYAETFVDLTGIMHEGIDALRKAGGNTPENEKAINKALNKAAAKLSGIKDEFSSDLCRFAFPPDEIEAACFDREAVYPSQIEPAEIIKEDLIEGQQTLEMFDAHKEPTYIKSPIIVTSGKRPLKFRYPLDKLNNNVWRLTEGHIGREIKLHMEKSGSQREALVTYCISFDSLENISISKALTPYDKRVYIAVGALLDAGNSEISYSQIYRAMGNNGNAGNSDLKRIENSLAKMRCARILVNNESEASTLKNRERFTYDGSLLPYEAVKVTINGKLVDAAVKPLREPPLLSFARERKQITVIPLDVLSMPVSKTDQTLLIQDYLIDRVAKAKNGKGQSKILYNTVFEAADIKDTKQRQRAKAKITKIFEHFKRTEWIADFSITSDGIMAIF